MTIVNRGDVSDPLIWKILRVVRQLLPIEDLDQLLRAGVELPRQELGVERCALWMLNIDGQNFRGTWGTDIHGNTTDERSQICSVTDLEKTLTCRFQNMEGWILREDESRFTWSEDGKRIEGSGWNTIIPLSGPEGNVGAFFQDAAITNAKLDPHVQDLMSVYCSLLGQLVGRRLAEKREFFLSHGLEELLIAADELMTYDDLDTLHRRIVELARERMGVVRCGLFVMDPSEPGLYRGTWGTDWDGNTTDEHSGSFTMDNHDVLRQRPGVVEVGTRRWTAMDPHPMSWFEPDGTRIDHAEGWNATHPLAVKDRMIGLLCSDPGKSLEPLDPRKMDLLTTYCDLAARILDRHQTQEGLRRAMIAAEQATKAKSDFLASMSHEIRTPLAGVLGMLRISLRDRALAGSTRDLLQKALGNAESLLGIINDILDYSKIEAGKLLLESIDFDLPELVENALSVFFESAAGRDLDFRISIGPDVPRDVRGDPTRIRQILVNLVGNAVKFTEQGFVEIGVRLVESSTERLVVRFSVVDSGIGIPADVLPRLFSKFEQADMSTTRRFGGTGLGLAISKQLVDAIGGTISVESVIGAGTKFDVDLPLRRGVERSVHDALQLSPHTHRLHVLCAEDYPTTQIIVRTLLEDRGHTVEIVDNGRSALERLSQADFDLVLMDGRMPVMDGLEAIGHIRTGAYQNWTFRDPDITIVALTANVSPEDRRKFMDAGVDDFVAKPIDEPEFHQAIEAGIHRQLERGLTLQPLIHASSSALDDFFGVESSDAAADAPPPPPPKGPSLRDRMEEVFRESLPQRLSELQEAMDRSDSVETGRLIHGLRGSAGYIEALSIASLSREMERLADKGDLPRVRTLFPDLLSLLSPWLSKEAE